MRAALFLVAAILALADAGLGMFGPAYYAPEGMLDYAAVVLHSSALLATGAALMYLFRNPLVGRMRWLLLFPAGGAVASGLGNLLEDGFGVDPAESAFFLGGVTMVFGLVIAGLAILTVKSRWRWTGLPLIAAGVGYGLDAGMIVGLDWLAFAALLLLLQRRYDQDAVRLA